MQTTTQTSGIATTAGSISRPVVETAEQVAARVKNGAAAAAMFGAGFGGVIFGILIVILIFRPSGLLGDRRREKV